MELLGNIWKDGKFWLAEVPVLDVASQGRTRKEALEMLEDAIKELLKSYFPTAEEQDRQLTLIDYQKKGFGITTSNHLFFASFLLIRQRGISHSTIRDVAERLGSKSPNSYAQYEQGKMRITLNQYERLLQAVNPQNPPALRIG